ncbi:MAG: hypothetical protein ACREH4_07215 [Vitreimonas sp.]
MRILTTFDVGVLAGWHMLARTLWAGAVILIVTLFDARTPFVAKLLAAACVMVVVWLPWFVATVWMAKSGIPKSAKGAAYAELSAGDKARLIAGYSGF